MCLVSGHRQICHPGKQKCFGPKEVCILEMKEPTIASRLPQWSTTLRPLAETFFPRKPHGLLFILYTLALMSPSLRELFWPLHVIYQNKTLPTISIPLHYFFSLAFIFYSAFLHDFSFIVSSLNTSSVPWSLWLYFTFWVPII